MTPHEKAEELYNLMIEKFKDYTGIFLEYKSKENCAKKCALIAVDEILKAMDNPDETYLMKHSVNYWQEVKKEIENL